MITDAMVEAALGEAVCDRAGMRRALEAALAASPYADMLAALKRAVAAADLTRPMHTGRTQACEDDYQACVAAIAKAEGGGDD